MPAELLRHAGTQFDPKVVEAFLAIPMEEWEEINRRIMLDGSSGRVVQRF